jgi:hypothetical protein
MAALSNTPLRIFAHVPYLENSSDNRNLALHYISLASLAYEINIAELNHTN